MIGLTSQMAGAGGLTAETSAILTRALAIKAKPPSAPMQVALDNFIKALKIAGIWAITDMLKVVGTDGSSNFADINCSSPALYGSSQVLTPTFKRAGGRQYGNKIGKKAYQSYTDTGWAPANGVNYLQNSCGRITYYKNIPNEYSVTRHDGSVNAAGNNNANTFNPQDSLNSISLGPNGAIVKITDAQFDLGDGMYYGGRNGGTVYASKGAGARVSIASASSAPGAYNDFQGIWNNIGNPFTDYDARTILLDWRGGFLTAQQVLDFNTALNAYLAVLNAVAPWQTIGSIYNKPSWNNLADFNVNGATVAVVGNALRFSGGNGGFAQSLDIMSPTKLGKYTQTIRFTIGTISATSYGPGIGIRSANTYGQNDLIVQFVQATITGQGKIVLYGTAGHTVLTSSAAATVYNIGDSIEMTVDVDTWTVSGIGYNLTTDPTRSSPISFDYTGLNSTVNTGRFSIFSLGGQFDVTLWTISSNELYQPEWCFLGDSKMIGQAAISQGDCFYSLMEKALGNTVTLRGGGYDRSIEYLLALPEIINVIKPKKVFIGGISNDIRNGVAAATWQANILSIISQLQAAGIACIFSTGFRETSVDQTPVSTWAAGALPASMVIDLVSYVIALDPDNTHPNKAGFATYTAQVLATGKII